MGLEQRMCDAFVFGLFFLNTLGLLILSPDFQKRSGWVEKFVFAFVVVLGQL